MSPTNWPERSAHAFQLANSVCERSHALGSQLAAFVEPRRDAVLRVEVGGGGGGDDLGRREPALLPIDAAVEHPLQDARPFRLELVAELDVALLLRDGDRERNQVEAAADGLVHRAQAGLVVAADHQLELRQIVEEILAHEARRNLVAAGQRLDLGFGPAPTFLGLGGGDQASAAQAGEVGRVPIAEGGGEGLDRRGAVIVAEDAGDGVDEGALAVGAVCRRGRTARARGSRRSARSRTSVAGIACSASSPSVTRSRNACHSGHPLALGATLVMWVMKSLARCVAHSAGAQVNGAVRGVEQPWVGIPLIDRRGQPAIGPCQPLDCGHGLGARQLLREPWTWRHSAAAARHTTRALSNTASVSSACQRVPS